MTLAHDIVAVNSGLLLSLPFREGVGVITRDEGKPGHLGIDLNGPPTWASLVTGMGVLDFNGATDYIDCPAANCVYLNFIAGDYSLVGWVRYQVTGLSQIVFGRYGVDLDGWELYLYDINNTLSLRHHHVSLAPTRTGCYSSGWTTGEWHLFGISRSGAYPEMYRNGVEVEVSYDAGGLQDPDTCNRDLVIGCRYTKNANWYEGYMRGLRIWNRKLSAAEHRFIFDTEKHWFGVS